MSETEEQARKRALKELERKNIAHYSVLLTAWIQTRMERDKTLITLSAIAIGLLVTILTTVGVRSIWELIFFAVAVGSFLITIWSSLRIYQLNSEHLEAAIRGSSEKDPRLERYDKRSSISFVIGGIFAILIAIVSATYQFLKFEDLDMSDKGKASQGTSKPLTAKESVSGITGLSPSAIGRKSLDGITDLRPQDTQPKTPDQPQSDTPSGDGSSGSDSGDSKE